MTIKELKEKNMKKQKLLIIYEDKDKREFCRDWDCNFIPQVGDLVDLSEFPLNNSIDKPAYFRVKARTIGYEYMRVLIEKE